jgi:hypothetical protein
MVVYNTVNLHRKYLENFKIKLDCQTLTHCVEYQYYFFYGRDRNIKW